MRKNNIMYMVLYPDKNVEKIRLFNFKNDAVQCFYQTAMDLILEEFTDDVLDCFVEDVKNALVGIYDEMSDYCCKVEEVDEFLDFRDEAEDVDLQLISEGNTLLEKININLKEADIPLIISCENFDCAEDYLDCFAGLLSNDFDVVDLVDYFEGYEKEFLYYIVKHNEGIILKDDCITIEIDFENYKTVKLFEAEVE